MEWSVYVRLACPTPTDEDDHHIDALVSITDAMWPYSASVTFGDGWISAQAEVDEPNGSEAVTAVAEAMAKAAAAAGLDCGDMIEVHVQPWADFEAELERPTLPDLVSGPEVAELLGITRQRVHQLAHEHPDFPEPAYQLGVGTLWFRRGIERFAETWQRRPGRPRRTA